MIHEEICTYEVCKLAKEKGFPQDPHKNDHCQMYCWDGLRNIHPLEMWVVWLMAEYNHDNLFAAPTQSLLQRWLREQGIDIEIYPIFPTNGKDYGCRIHKRSVRNKPKNIGYFSTYELALEDALKYALENLV